MLLECSMIGQIIYDSGGLGANRNVSGKLGMKLAIQFVQTYQPASRFSENSAFLCVP